MIFYERGTSPEQREQGREELKLNEALSREKKRLGKYKGKMSSAVLAGFLFVSGMACANAERQAGGEYPEES